LRDLLQCMPLSESLALSLIATLCARSHSLNGSGYLFDTFSLIFCHLLVALISSCLRAFVRVAHLFYFFFFLSLYVVISPFFSPILNNNNNKI
jgi:hypothetical protein